jgi:hypothetical protein
MTYFTRDRNVICSTWDFCFAILLAPVFYVLETRMVLVYLICIFGCLSQWKDCIGTNCSFRSLSFRHHHTTLIHTIVMGKWMKLKCTYKLVLNLIYCYVKLTVQRILKLELQFWASNSSMCIFRNIVCMLIDELPAPNCNSKFIILSNCQLNIT